MTMLSRRQFLVNGTALGSAMLLDGCHYPMGDAPERVPYGDTIGDRLWMWGHHPMSFAAQLQKGENYNLPLERRIDMADACRTMGISGCFVVRWFGMPVKAELPDFMRQFHSTRRVGFSITDSAAESVEEKIRLGLEFADRMPNLTEFVMDDFWCKHTRRPPMALLDGLREQLNRRGMKLSVVLYSDTNGLKREYREVLDYCDEVTFWFWRGRNLDTIEPQVAKLKELVGSEKPILLGQYMYDFGDRKPMPGADMEKQLAATSRLLAQRAINGVIFHCTPLVDMNLDAVRISKEWIRTWRSAPF